MANSYEYLPLPGFNAENNAYANPELLYSQAGFSQDGGTLRGGQGELLLGTLVSRVSSSDKRFVKYTGAAGQKAVGCLRKSVDTGASGAPDQLVNIVFVGIVKLELVCAAHGGTTASIPAAVTSAVSDLGGRIDDGRAFLKY